MGGMQVPQRAGAESPMLGAPTYQLNDLGLMSSPLCLSLLTSEMRTLRNLAGRAPSPSEPSAKARS